MSDDFVDLVAQLTNYIQNERIKAYNEGVDDERSRSGSRSPNGKAGNSKLPTGGSTPSRDAKKKKKKKPEVLGITKEGIKILKPFKKSDHFTDKELREAIDAVRSRRKAK